MATSNTAPETILDLYTIKRQFENCERILVNYQSFLEQSYEEEYESSFADYFLDSKILETFSKLKLEVCDITNTSATSVGGNSNNTSNNITEVKLPSINLPIFSGRYDEWLSFKDTFTALIDSNDKIAPIQKLQYLKTALKGDASDVIKCIEINEANYKVAFDLLIERFENKRLITKNHIRALYEYPILTKESYHGIRQLIDTFSQHLRALESLGRPVDKWDDLITYLITSKLPTNTRKEWEEKIPSSNIPTLKELREFLTHKCHALEAFSSKDSVEKQTYKNKYQNNATYNIASNKSLSCPICNESHLIYYCKNFLNLSISDRINTVRNKHLCLNCLQFGHDHKNCKSSLCKKCNRSHNTLLHLSKENNTSNANSATGSTQQGSSRSNSSSSTVNQQCSGSGVPQFNSSSCTLNDYSTNSDLQHNNMQSFTLLSTCLIQIEDIWGNNHTSRILLDSGSQINFITSDLANKLGLQKRPVNLPVMGINNKLSSVKWCVDTTIKSNHTNFEQKLTFYILDKITSQIPAQYINPSYITIPKNIKLADPLFFESREIDALIGIELFYKLLCVGQFTTNQPNLILQKTLLGWVISGKLSFPITNSKAFCNISLIELDNNLKNFWEIEQNIYPSEPIRSSEERDCETHFAQTHKRDQTGRFIVSLPWKGDPHLLGNSYHAAKRCFLTLERKLNKNSDLKQEYDHFINEFIHLQHMKRVSNDVTSIDSGYYLPHHAVIKHDSLTTKLRVVFNASMKTDTGKSLNDLLMVGPNIQSDLFSILIRFRSYKYVLTGDIQKMYRQVRIDENDTKYQRILWRTSSDDPIDIYEIQTVTYGTAPGSFLATRCLEELAKSVNQSNPIISEIISNDFYIDDLITGGDTVHAVQAIRIHVHELLSSGGFKLHKWASSDDRILADISNESETNLILTFDEGDYLKTLGIRWVPASDNIEYHTQTENKQTKVTKRTILSDISKIFDPLGLLGPTIVISKLIMQKLWQLQIGWDEAVPQQIFSNWSKFLNELNNLSKIKIPRKFISETEATFELNGFSDASEYAYAACLYITSRDPCGTITSMLMCAKSRVAPIKTISLPRLELCAAVLLVQLVNKVQNAVRLHISNISYYTDSMITLSWIRSCPTKWKVFVANRVGEIQSLSEKNQWHHVNSHENPADIISRGAYPSQLINNQLWWHGPLWINGTNKIINEPEIPNLPEAKALFVSHNHNITNISFLERYSDLDKLLRVVCYCKRFIYNIRNKHNKRTEQISISELYEAENTIIRLVQQINFPDEIHSLERSTQLPNNSKLLCLNPFLDDKGIIRVGGRIKNSKLDFDIIHPIVLPSKSHFTYLIVLKTHKLNLHSGIQTTLANIRTRYWPLSGRNTVRQILHGCIICFKSNPHITEPQMGNLPNYRIEPIRPFLKTGIDYFGPLQIKEGTRRSKKVIKCYGAIFICMASRAIHIELVSNLSSEAFLACLRRFIARRGHVSDLYSDNGSNFVGAANELNQIYKLLNDQNHFEIIQNELSSKRIQWHFIPPRAPHFGGYWEAAVKNTKHHLRRIAGNALLTFEEMYTLLTQIESVLNSRPITPLSNDPNDFSYLTPGHFLIGDYMTNLQEPSLLETPINRLSRWQLVQRLQQHFWVRWQREFLTTLHERRKWQKADCANLHIDQLVLIREDNCPPFQWKTGRVQEVHPGSDGIVRTATLRTSTGIVKRPVVKLSILPIEGN